MSNLNLKRASRETQQENPAIEKQKEKVSLVVMAKKVSTSKTEQGNNKKSHVHLYMAIELFFARASRGDQQENPVREKQREKVSLVVMAKKVSTSKTEQGNNKKSHLSLHGNRKNYFSNAHHEEMNKKFLRRESKENS